MDQLRRPRKHAHGSSRGERSVRRRHPASEMAGAPARRRRLERRRPRHPRRIARVPRRILCQVAAPRRVRIPRRYPAHLRRQIPQNRPPRTIRQLAVGVGGTASSCASTGGAPQVPFIISALCHSERSEESWLGSNTITVTANVTVLPFSIFEFPFSNFVPTPACYSRESTPRTRLFGLRRGGYLSAWMRSAGTSTSLTPRKEKSSFTRYLGGSWEICLTMWPTASVTAAWNITPPACKPARFTRTSCPGSNIASSGESSPRHW